LQDEKLKQKYLNYYYQKGRGRERDRKRERELYKYNIMVIIVFMMLTNRKPTEIICYINLLLHFRVVIMCLLLKQ